MSFDLIIKNGTVILENEARVVDIAVKDGKIAAIGQDLGDAKDVMDASGLVVSPGMVDAHTHISEPGRSHWEGYETGTRAAAKGGITTMIEMPLNQGFCPHWHNFRKHQCLCRKSSGDRTFYKQSRKLYRKSRIRQSDRR